jgi:hypothetical protein
MKGINMKLAAGTVALALAGLVGCASTSDLDSLRSEIRQANDTAQSASATAQAASKDAAAASQAAADAKATAEAAQATADATEEKVNRMFKKAMYK